MKTFVCVTDTTDRPVVVFLNAIVTISEGPFNAGQKTSNVALVNGRDIGIKMPIEDLLVVMNGQ